MPTYEYKCNACNHRMEAFQSMRDKPLRKCPECGKNALERLIGIGAAVLFKGSGFYQTDYRSESYKKAAASDSKPADSKPAETAAAPASGGAKPESSAKSTTEGAKPKKTKAPN